MTMNITSIFSKRGKLAPNSLYGEKKSPSSLTKFLKVKAVISLKEWPSKFKNAFLFPILQKWWMDTIHHFDTETPMANRNGIITLNQIKKEQSSLHSHE